MLHYSRAFAGLQAYLLEDLLPQRKGSPVSLLGGAAVRYLAAKADAVYAQLRAIPALAAIGMIDGDMLDVDGIYTVLCEQMEHDGSTTIPIPLLGALTLTRPDIDAMYRRIQAS